MKERRRKFYFLVFLGSWEKFFFHCRPQISFIIIIYWSIVDCKQFGRGGALRSWFKRHFLWLHSQLTRSASDRNRFYGFLKRFQVEDVDKHSHKCRLLTVAWVDSEKPERWKKLNTLITKRCFVLLNNPRDFLSRLKIADLNGIISNGAYYSSFLFWNELNNKI